MMTGGKSSRQEPSTLRCLTLVKIRSFLVLYITGTNQKLNQSNCGQAINPLIRSENWLISAKKRNHPRFVESVKHQGAAIAWRLTLKVESWKSGDGKARWGVSTKARKTGFSAAWGCSELRSMLEPKHIEPYHL